MIDEVWSRYGEKVQEFRRDGISVVRCAVRRRVPLMPFCDGQQCKDVSGGLPTFISPWIDGKKAVMGTDKLTKENAVSVQEHEKGVE